DDDGARGAEFGEGLVDVVGGQVGEAFAADHGAGPGADSVEHSSGHRVVPPRLAPETRKRGPEIVFTDHRAPLHVRHSQRASTGEPAGFPVVSMSLLLSDRACRARSVGECPTRTASRSLSECSTNPIANNGTLNTETTIPSAVTPA